MGSHIFYLCKKCPMESAFDLAILMSTKIPATHITIVGLQFPARASVIRILM